MIVRALSVFEGVVYHCIVSHLDVAHLTFPFWTPVLLDEPGPPSGTESR